MAASDILNLNRPMAPRAIRWLYLLALILIAIGVIMGLVQGVGALNRAMNPRPAVTAAAPGSTSGAATPAGPDVAAQAPAPGPQANRPDRERRFFNRREFRDFNMRRRNPAMFGALVIVRTLVKGFIQLMLVRILAELGLAVLAMPRKT